MESIAIDMGEGESSTCPVGLEVLLNHSEFTINLSPKGGVGDFEILNSKQEVIIVSQKHLSTISLLEHTSRSELLTIDLNNVSDMRISCPPSDEITSIGNTRMGVLQPNTLELTTITGRSTSTTNQPSSFKQFNFKFQTRSSSSSSDSQPCTDKTQGNGNETCKSSTYNFQVVDEGEIVVAEISLSNLSSRATVRFPGHVPLTPVQAAVIFGGIAFQIYAMKKQKKQITTLLIATMITLTLLLLLAYLANSS